MNSEKEKEEEKMHQFPLICQLIVPLHQQVSSLYPMKNPNQIAFNQRFL